MVYFSAVMAQWIRVWPQRTVWWAEEVLFPHTGLTAVLNRLAAFVTQVVFSEEGQRGWLRTEERVCVNSRKKNTHIHNKAQRIRHRSHHQPTLEHLPFPPSCRLGPSPVLVPFGWSVSLISTYASQGKPGWRRGQAWAHPINLPLPNHPSLSPPFHPSISKPECINLPFLTVAINKGRSEPCVMGG